MTLENTKAGDKIYCTSGWCNIISVEIVDRVTKNTVICRKMVIRRDGSIRGGYGYHTSRYKPLTTEIIKEYNLQNLRVKAKQITERIKMDTLSEETLNALIKLLTPTEEQK